MKRKIACLMAVFALAAIVTLIPNPFGKKTVTTVKADTQLSGYVRTKSPGGTYYLGVRPDLTGGSNVSAVDGTEVIVLSGKYDNGGWYSYLVAIKSAPYLTGYISSRWLDIVEPTPVPTAIPTPVPEPIVIPVVTPEPIFTIEFDDFDIVIEDEDEEEEEVMLADTTLVSYVGLSHQVILENADPEEITYWIDPEDSAKGKAVVDANGIVTSRKAGCTYKVYAEYEGEVYTMTVKVKRKAYKPKFYAEPRYMYAVKDEILVRTAPKTGSATAFVLDEGEQVTVIGEIVNASGNKFYIVSDEGSFFYVYAGNVGTR